MEEEATLGQKVLCAICIVISVLGLALIGGFDDAEARVISPVDPMLDHERVFELSWEGGQR